jgi:hypothetical protein
MHELPVAIQQRQWTHNEEVPNLGNCHPGYLNDEENREKKQLIRGFVYRSDHQLCLDR